MSKEYNDRWTKPLVNPGYTIEEYEKMLENSTDCPYKVKECTKGEECFLCWSEGYEKGD